MNWTQPICAECWGVRNPNQEPYRVFDAPTGICCYCGERAEHGIFVRVDPRNAEIAQLKARNAELESLTNEGAVQLNAAKYIVWCARWAFIKLLYENTIMPHAECEHFLEMLPQITKFLEVNQQVGVNFTLGAANLSAALATQDEGEKP